MARSLANGIPARKKQLTYFAKTCVEPAFAYFKTKFEGDLKPQVEAFKAARIFSPSKAKELQPTTSDVDELKCFSFNYTFIEELKAELPTYLACCDGVSTEIPVCNWWRNHESELPKWAQACRHILLCQPSSAAAERVFSILNNSFSDRQSHSLEDYIQISVMLQYNRK